MIWVVGNGGMLGQELCRLFDTEKIDYSGTDRELSILETEVLKKHAEKYNPEWIINCSAYTAVDKAEDDRDSAFKINRDGVENLAKIAAVRDIPIIHISTDYVFDGTSAVALKEDAPTGPIGVYGQSKLAGEEVLRDQCLNHFIIRTAWLYGQYGPNFVYTMLKLMNERDSIKVVSDQVGSPTWTGDLSQLILRIISDKSNKYGTYHFSGEGQCSWYDFACEIYRLGRQKGMVESECDIAPCTSAEFQTRAKRPAFSLLSKEKVKSEIHFIPPEWRASLRRFIEEITERDII